jgi:hypothetical protein
MRPEVTALLEEDDHARQILACWPAAVGEWERRRRVGDLLDVWAEVAGVDLLVILETGMKLLRCGAALDNGQVAPEAAGYIMQHALSRAGPRFLGGGRDRDDGPAPPSSPRPAPPPGPGNVRPFRPRGAPPEGERPA